MPISDEGLADFVTYSNCCCLGDFAISDEDLSDLVTYHTCCCLGDFAISNEDLRPCRFQSLRGRLCQGRLVS